MCILYNLGCKLNQYEGYCLEQKYGAQDDIVIVNTCCVTAEAEHKSRKKFHHALRHHPGKHIIATGCACTVHREHYREAYSIIDVKQRNCLINGIFPEPSRTRYFLKIQDGCQEPCTFCIVSTVRNKIISKPISSIKEEILWAYSHGYPEIVLVGANIGLYGRDIDTDLPALLKNISVMKNLPRVRLSSIEPTFLTDDLIAATRDLDVCRHFHVPIQSAAHDVLRAMGRTYDEHDLEKIFTRITTSFSHVAIGVDVIIGFPNEDDQCFKETFTFLQDMPISHAHLFTYSPRPGTPAFKRGDPVPKQTKRERYWSLELLIMEKNLQFRTSMRGQIYNIIVDHIENGVSGLSDNYIRIHIDTAVEKGSLVPVKIIDVERKRTVGEVIAP